MVIYQSCLCKEAPGKDAQGPLSTFFESLVQSIRQQKTIKGISIKAVEHKMACYADNILIYLGDPTKSLPQLMNSVSLSLDIN